MSVLVVSISIDRFPPDDAGARSHIMPLAKTDDVPLARHHDPPKTLRTESRMRKPDPQPDCGQRTKTLMA
jgi:hypothetical protein